MTEYHAVLVFDGDCPFCSAAASALRRLPGVGAIPWGNEAAQSFLEAQFKETPFALAFTDREEERVYVGRGRPGNSASEPGCPC
jgi:predicted DCC family thiol-disulfide oxidoreductase YuxK